MEGWALNYIYLAERGVTPDQCFEPAAIAVAGGKIAYVGPDQDEARRAVPGACLREYPGCTAVPGFIDLHVHGGQGWDFYDCPPEAIGRIAEFYAARGTTTLLATVTTGQGRQMAAAIGKVAAYLGKPGPGARVGGIYLEGPFCSHARRATFRPEYLLAPDWQVLAPWVEKWGWAIKYVGLAPELPGADQIIKALRARGIRTSVCHSDGSHEDLERALGLGVSHLTHFYNGMAPFNHRDPGLVGGALARGGVTVELIADLHHVHPLAIDILLRCLGPEKVCLITDAMRGAGCPPGKYMISEQEAVVRGGKALIGEDTLAGSLLTMAQGVRNLLALGYSERAVFTMAAKTPAHAGGFNDRGQLKPGLLADMVFLDRRHRIKATVVAGELAAVGEGD